MSLGERLGMEVRFARIYSREFRVRSTALPVTLASDHRPVVADLLLDRPD